MQLAKWACIIAEHYSEANWPRCMPAIFWLPGIPIRTGNQSCVGSPELSPNRAAGPLTLLLCLGSFGVPCVVGTGNATSVIGDGQDVTVCCSEGAEGHVYAGEIPFTVDKIDASLVSQTKSAIMLTLGDPEQAFALSVIPNSGVGLARTEFIINNDIGIHPMALVRYPKLKILKPSRRSPTALGARIPENSLFKDSARASAASQPPFIRSL